MLYTKDERMLGSCCVDVLLLLLFAMVWCVWTAESWLVRTQRAALSHVYCLPALCLSFYIFSSPSSAHSVCLRLRCCVICCVTFYTETQMNFQHTPDTLTHFSLYRRPPALSIQYSALWLLFFVALSLSKNQSHSAPGSAAGLHDGSTVPHCFIYVYSRSCHFTCRAKNLTSCHIFKTHTQGNHWSLI